MREAKHRRGTACGGCGAPKTAEAREEKRTRAIERPRNKKHSNRLDEIRHEIIAQAEKRLAGWVAAQKAEEAPAGGKRGTQHEELAERTARC